MTVGDQTYSAVIDIAGAAVVTIRTRMQMTWIMSQITVELSGAPVGASCVIRKNGYLVTPIIVTGDSAAGDPPLVCRPSDTVTVEFAGCTPGQVGKVLVFYDEVLPG